LETVQSDGSRKNKIMKRYLFVDGTNLYAGQYALFGPKRYLDFSEFIKQLEEEINKKFDKIYFYASYSPRGRRLTKKEKEYLTNEYFFYKSVKKTQKVVFFQGYRSKASGKEKVVDVKLASDLVSFSIVKKYQDGYLLTGDADFLEALFSSEKFSKGVRNNIICLENKIMYRGSYYFPTTIIRLTGRKLGVKEKYYKIVNLDVNRLLGEIE
jgi:uncharacterized LabA/DUF88 family protein